MIYMMPALPASYFISKQMDEHIRNKKIANIVCLDFVQPKYDSSDFFINFDKLIGSTIVRADSNFIVTDSGWLCEFGYVSNCLRYFETDADYDIKIAKSNKTGFFKVKYMFGDGSCLYFVYSGWCSRFQIRPVEPPVYAYPFRSKFPLEVMDEKDFTFENLKNWLSDKENWNVIETLTLARGSTDVTMYQMNYVLWECGIHPKTKAGKLGEEEINKIFNAIGQYADDVRTGKITCEYVDIFGVLHSGKDELTNFSRDICLKCGAQIEAVSVGGTKAFVCPECQKVKK